LVRFAFPIYYCGKSIDFHKKLSVPRGETSVFYTHIETSIAVFFRYVQQEKTKMKSKIRRFFTNGGNFPSSFAPPGFSTDTHTLTNGHSNTYRFFCPNIERKICSTWLAVAEIPELLFMLYSDIFSLKSSDFCKFSIFFIRRDVQPLLFFNRFARF